MMPWVVLAATVFYTGYNISIKLSGAATVDQATTTVVGAIVLQIAALTTSLVFLSAQMLAGGHSFALGTTAYLWAAFAGVCIGAAEISYFYIFGSGHGPPVQASVAIPVIVGGSVALSAVVAVQLLHERMSAENAAGVVLVILGIVLIARKGPPLMF